MTFDFGVSYDITTLHFWNYTAESYDVDQVDFTFYDSIGDVIGSETLFPALGSSGGIAAEDIPLNSPLNTRSVSAFLTGSNREVDFQNIGFTAEISGPDKDPAPGVSPVPLPAAGWMLVAGIASFGFARRPRSCSPPRRGLALATRPRAFAMWPIPALGKTDHAAEHEYGRPAGE